MCRSARKRPTVIPRSHFVNKIRELGYTYKTRQKRTQLWRKRGGTHCMSVPLTDHLEDEYVISTLRQAGCKDDEIRRFLIAAKS